MGCAVPSKLEKFLSIVFLVAAVLACGSIVIASVVFTFQRFEIVGDKASLSDAITLGSVFFAGLLAVFGWLIVEGREKRERERIAKADAVILYRKMSDAARYGVALLFYLTAAPSGNLFKWFATPSVTNEGDLLKLYEGMQRLMKQVHQGLPNTANCIEDLSSLYVFNTALGDCFMEAVLSIQELELHLSSYLGRSSIELSRRFANSPEREKRLFFNIVGWAAHVCVNLESSRKMLEGVQFSVEPSMRNFVEYGNRLRDVSGRENPFAGAGEDAEVDAESYVKVFEATSNFCADTTNDFEFYLYKK